MKLLMAFAKKLKKLPFNELIYISSDILIKAIAFISMPLFLNVMTTSEFGEFSLYQSISGIIMVGFGLNISSGIVRYCVEHDNKQSNLATAIWIVLAASCCMSIIMLLLYLFTDIFPFTLPILVAILVYTTSNCIYLIGLEIIRSTGNSKKYGLSGVIFSVVSTVLGLGLVYYFKSDLALWRFLSITLPTVIIAGFWAWGLIKKEGIVFNMPTAKYLLGFSIPLIPYTLSTTILVQINKVFVGQIGLAEVGIYSFAANLASLAYVVSLASNRALQYEIFTSIRDDRKLGNKVYVNMGMFWTIYALLIFGTNTLVNIFGNKDYSGAINIIPILVLGYGFCYVYAVFSNYMYYYKRTIVLSVLSIISAILLCLSSSFLVPSYNYFGAAISMAFAYFALFVMGYIYTVFYLKIKFINFKYLVIYILLLIIPVFVKILLID